MSAARQLASAELFRPPALAPLAVPFCLRPFCLIFCLFDRGKWPKPTS